MQNDSSRKTVAATGMCAMPVIFVGGVMGLVTQGKGFPSPAKRLVGVLVDRIQCLHVGSNTLPKHSAYMTRELTAAEHLKCAKECGFACQQK